jgi:hypothetical protein
MLYFAVQSPPYTGSVTLPVDLPDELAQRVQRAADAKGVSPEEVVIEAVRVQFGADDTAVTKDPFASIADELRQIASDGTLRHDIDAAIDDPELAVG